MMAASLVASLRTFRSIRLRDGGSVTGPNALRPVKDLILSVERVAAPFVPRYPGFKKSDTPSEKVGKDLSIGPVPLVSLAELGLIPNEFSLMKMVALDFERNGLWKYDLGACAMQSPGVPNIP
jgi:hypothetical protein